MDAKEICTPFAAPAAKAKRSGGRSARVQASVLHAAFRVFVERGFTAFTIAEVAARAQVHETSIYRRWKTKTGLLLDACLDFAADAFAPPDKGSLREDLADIMSRVAAVLQSPDGKALLALSLAVDTDSIAARRTYWQKRLEEASIIVARAIARGEVPADTNPRHVVEAAIAPLYFRALVSFEPIEDWPLDEMIGQQVAALSRRQMGDRKRGPRTGSREERAFDRRYR